VRSSFVYFEQTNKSRSTVSYLSQPLHILWIQKIHSNRVPYWDNVFRIFWEGLLLPKGDFFCSYLTCLRRGIPTSRALVSHAYFAMYLAYALLFSLSSSLWRVLIPCFRLLPYLRNSLESQPRILHPSALDPSKNMTASHLASSSVPYLNSVQNGYIILLSDFNQHL